MWLMKNVQTNWFMHSLSDIVMKLNCMYTAKLSKSGKKKDWCILTLLIIRE